MAIESEIQRYLNQHAARSQHTAKTYRNALTRFGEFLEECEVDSEGPVSQLTIALARDFVTWLATQRYTRGRTEHQLSMRSRSLYAQSVSGLYRMLVLEGKLDMTYGEYTALHEHMVRSTSYTVPPIEKKLPPDEVVDAVLAAALTPPDLEELDQRKQRRLRLIWLRNRAIILGLVSTGMRVGELVSLRRSDLDHDDQGAWVSGKGDKERFVRFSNQAWIAMVAYLEARHDEWVATKVADFPLFCRHDRSAGDHRRLPLTSLTVERLITDLADDAGVLERFNLTPHSFRHWFATRFLRHTRNLALTQDVMGHASPQTTRIYAKTTKEDHIAAHESLFDHKSNSDDE
jgi:site-specific recombinase XerD